MRDDQDTGGGTQPYAGAGLHTRPRGQVQRPAPTGYVDGGGGGTQLPPMAGGTSLLKYMAPSTPPSVAISVPMVSWRKNINTKPIGLPPERMLSKTWRTSGG